jgi:hypothetical protein
MQVEQVRSTLQGLADSGGVMRLSQETGVPHMTLRRFLHENTQPHPEQWQKLVAYVRTLEPMTPAEAVGVLRAVLTMRRHLATLEASARAVLEHED